MTAPESRALMLRELEHQPEILLAAAGPLTEAAALLRPIKGRVWIGGCGDGLFAARALALHFRRRGWDVRPASAAEMLWDADIREGDTVVGISISGSTRRTVEAVAAAAARGARTIAVTLKPDSALAEAASDVLSLPYAPISRAIPHGLDYHVTLLALAALAGGVKGEKVADMLREATPRTLRQSRDVAARLSPDVRFFFLGSGAALGSASYGAAKMHEAGGLPAWSFEAENFAHGAHFMLRPGDHAVLCGSGGPGDLRTAAMRSGLERLGVSVSDAALTDGVAGGDTLLAALHAALVTQAFCLAVAEQQDLDITDPARGSAAAEVQREWFGWSSN